jgi:LemA protein
MAKTGKIEKQGMKTSTKVWIGVAIVVVILLFWIIGSYNGFVGMKQDVDSKWSEVENQYQRQVDLIENIVSTVSSQVGVETKFVKEIIDARTAAQDYVNAASSQKDIVGQKMNSGVQTFINAVAENYPQLLASEGYTALRDELSGTQNRIATARGRYIESVQRFNTAVKRFPGNVIAGMFGFNSVEYYEAETTKTPSLGTGQLPQ